jgi:hypothetical protein
MNLTILETDNSDNEIIKTYYDKTNKTNKKKKISYDDILSSMNLRVNNGHLEFINNNSGVESIEANLQNQKVTGVPNNNEIVEPPLLTRKEYIKKQIIDYVNYRNELIRISKIKSTKLLFSSNTQNVPFVPKNNNNLFKLKF